MKVDVVIPVYKPGRELFALLDKLEKQTVPARRIILMNTEDKGADHWRQLTSRIDFPVKYPNGEVVYVPKGEFDHGGTRHQGIERSDADIVVCMTQDAMPVDGHLLENLTAHLSGKVAAAYARQLPGEASSEFERVSRSFNYPAASRYQSLADLEKLGIKTFFCSNVCAAYRRDVYEKLGGFARHAIFNEDMIYASALIRAGYTIAYESRAQVVHAHNYTNLQQLRRNFDLGVSQADHPEVFGAIHSESEGKRLVASAWRSMKARRKLCLFPGFCLQCAFKYAGYLLGKHYRKLPRPLILKITTNKEYWRQNTQD